MGDTSIEWTDRVWNPVRGCSMAKGSENGGCLNCYAARIAARNLPEMRSPSTGEPFAVMRDSGPRWTGKVELIDSKLGEPLRWKKPGRVFVNSMSDLFHESLPDSAIDQVFAVMALCPQQTFQVLTKRPERMGKWMCAVERKTQIAAAARILSQACSQFKLPSVTIFDGRRVALGESWLITSCSLPNVHAGVSIENQPTADLRIPLLLQTPAAVRFISYEPALGPVDLNLKGIDWVIAGGESGPGARPAHPQWFRDVRDQCVAAGVPFFFKQWGAWAWHQGGYAGNRKIAAKATFVDGENFNAWMAPVGKKAAGRLLDGVEWNQFPEARA